jgi:nitroreductase
MLPEDTEARPRAAVAGRGGLADPSATALLLRSRRTIHDFRPEPPPQEPIRRALELARWAPNHYLTEPWHFYLLGPETQRHISELNASLVAAAKGPDAGKAKLQRWLAIPGWVAVTCECSNDPEREWEDYAACCCAVHNFSLYLWSAGIGVKWTTGAVTRDPTFYDLIWVDPERERVVGVIWYGYPAEVPQTTRRPLEQVLVELP